MIEAHARMSPHVPADFQSTAEAPTHLYGLAVQERKKTEVKRISIAFAFA
jgi:hypothetical protein